MIMRFKLTTLVGLALLAGSSPAWATATLVCDASLKTLDFSIMGIVPDSQGSPLLQVRGEVNAYPEGVVPAPAQVVLSDGNRTQYWLDDASLKLGFYVESDAPFRSAELTIETQVRKDDPAYFDGTFRFESYAAVVGGEPVEVKNEGKVVCSVG
jgi:hypothetical protein